MLLGKKINANTKTLKDVKNLVLFGIPNAMLASVLLVVVSVHQFVSMECWILEFPVRNFHMEEE